MKRISLTISLFLCSLPPAHAMEKLKKIRKSIVSSLSKKQPKPPVLMIEKSRIEGNACVQAIKDNDHLQLDLELSIIGADVNYISDGKSLFYLAYEERNKKYTNTNILEMLLTHENIDLHSRNAQGSTPLHIACQLGLTSTVASMLKKSPQTIYCRDKRGYTPLHTAVACGKKDCTELLLSHDLNLIGMQEDSGNTPLHIAISLREECIKQLQL